MQRFSFKIDRCPGVLTVDFETSDIESLALPNSELRLDDLPYPSAGAVIDVIGRTSATQIYLLQLILEVPVHRGQMRHRRHVAVCIVTVGLHLIESIADGSSGQAIALLALLNEADLQVIISTRPARTLGPVAQSLKVSSGIVFVPLAISTERLQIIRMRDVPGEGPLPVAAIWRVGLKYVLTDVLSSFRLNETIDSIVCVRAHRLDDMTVSDNGLQCE